jgi:hypothetical protein
MSEQNTVQRKSDLLSDIQTIRSQVEDGLLMGDSMFGRFAHVDVAREVKSRTEELQRKKEALEQEIREKEALVQRASRDFTDVKHTLPETLERQHIQFIEDYTLLFLSLAYVFMVVSAIIFYVVISEQKTKALGKAVGYAILGTMIAAILLNMIA